MIVQNQISLDTKFNSIFFVFMNKVERLKAITDRKIWLAPLAGYTNKAFRCICKETGADVLVSEMINADGFKYGINQKLDYTEFDPSQRPFGIQFYAGKVDILQKAVEAILALNPDFIDLNMGCPVQKVINRGGGSALMKNNVNAANLVKAAKEVLTGTDILLTAKIRSGWDAEQRNFVPMGKALEEAGVDAICFHPRTKKEYFHGKCDWDQIRILKENVSIPIIGNGDIITADDALQMLNTTGCNSIMIGRGAIGKPWFFSEVSHKIKFGKDLILTNSQKFDIVLKHYELALSYVPPKKVLREIKAHLIYYAKNATIDKSELNFLKNSQNPDTILNYLKSLFL